MAVFGAFPKDNGVSQITMASLSALGNRNSDKAAMTTKVAAKHVDDDDDEAKFFSTTKSIRQPVLYN